MTDVSIYFGCGILFVLATLPTAIMAVRSTSPLRVFVPFSVLAACALAYFGLGSFIGTAMPVDAVPGWRGPDFGRHGVAVLGGRIEGADSAYLLIQESEAEPPRSYFFSGDPEMVKNLKQAMQGHAAASGGETWGFAMTADGSTVPGIGKDGKPGAAGVGSLETRQSKYHFGEAAVEVMPAKEAGAAPISIN